MKRLFILLVTLVILAACNHKKSKITNSGNGDSIVVKTQPTVDTEDLQKQAEILEKLPALSPEQLKAVMPVDVMGVPQSNYSETNMSGAKYGHADFIANDSTHVSVGIYDCAGSEGVGIYNTQYVSLLNNTGDDEKYSTRTFEFSGHKAVERCEKMKKNCTLTFFAGNRYLVMMEGTNVTDEELKQIATGMHLK